MCISKMGEMKWMRERDRFFSMSVIFLLTISGMSILINNPVNNMIQ